MVSVQDTAGTVLAKLATYSNVDAGDYVQASFNLSAYKGKTIRINFKAGCPSEFDCADVHACPPATPPEPRLDYLAKDYDSFRRLMLDRMSQLVPGFAERSPADVIGRLGR